MVPSLTCSSKIRDVLGCFSIPVRCASVILLYSFAILVHLTQTTLRIRVALRRSSVVPPQRLLEITLAKPALLISGTEPHLCLVVALFGFGQQLFSIYLVLLWTFRLGFGNPHYESQFICLVLGCDLPTAERWKIDASYHERLPILLSVATTYRVSHQWRCWTVQSSAGNSRRRIWLLFPVVSLSPIK